MRSWSVRIHSLEPVRLILKVKVQNMILNLCFGLFSSAYNDTKQLETNYCNCTKGKYFIQNTFSAPHHTKWACPFMQSMLEACSGFEDPTFGYNCTMPCVIIKMNRVSS